MMRAARGARLKLTINIASNGRGGVIFNTRCSAGIANGAANSA
jgi:hypothetical protein